MIRFRPYQSAAIDAIAAEFAAGKKSTLVVLPTGCGKTVTFTGYAMQHAKDRVLVLAHRGELVRQAANTAKRFGAECDIEMGEITAGDGCIFGQAKFVAGTVQSLCRPSRLKRYDPKDFSLVIVDEAHHCVRSNATYRTILEHFADVPLLGVTATADRSDKFALGEVFESEAYRLLLDDAFDQGWLCPIDQLFVPIDGFDLAQCSIVGGDFSGSSLEHLLQESGEMGKFSGEIAKRCKDEPTLVFAPGVASAHQIAKLLVAQGIASRTIDGSTPSEVRVGILEEFEKGAFSCLVGCDVFTEGFDSPRIRNVVVARPTKSRSRYVQMIGRGLRTMTGVLDGLEAGTAEQRLAAIAASEKPCCRIYDLIGSSLNHDLVTAISIFAGRHSAEVQKRALNIAASKGKPAKEAVAEAQAEVAKIELRKQVHLQTVSRSVDVSIYGNPEADVPAGESKGMKGKPPTEKMRAILRKNGYNPGSFNMAQAARIINQLKTNRAMAPASDGQRKALIRNGEKPDRTRQQASFILDFAHSRNWERRDFRFTPDRFSIRKSDVSGRDRFHPVVISPDGKKWMAEGTFFDSVDQCRLFISSLLEGVPAPTGASA